MLILYFRNKFQIIKLFIQNLAFNLIFSKRNVGQGNYYCFLLCEYADFRHINY